MNNYTPREGFDFFVDLYGVAGVDAVAPTEDIKEALNAKARQYHPDRLHGLAPEFQAKGERMSKLLNRARAILLDPTKREEYDQLLAEWDGPISTDCVPTFSLEALMRAQLLSLAPDELNEVIAKQTQAATTLASHDPTQQSLLGRLYQTADESERAGLRGLYDGALLAEDAVCAIEERTRSDLLGIASGARFETKLDHVDRTAQALETSRNKHRQVAAAQQLGSVSTRLALLAGETTNTGAVEPAAQYGLSDHFEAQAQRITQLAQRRQELLRQRLELFQPTYPLPELQTTTQTNFVIGVNTHANTNPGTMWFNFAFDPEARQLANLEVPPEIGRLLQNQDFAGAYGKGFNILTFEPLENIDLQLLLEEACNKHLQQYFSNDTPK